MNDSVSLLTALLAGFISFISPCVLPIVPGYLSFISGVNVGGLKGGEVPKGLTAKVTLTSLAFVLGFSTVFVALGAASTLIGQVLQQYQRQLAMVGGVIIIILGLHTAGILPIKWLLYEKRTEVKAKPLGLLGAYVVGLAFAFGWTPCIGPILGAILLYASQQETVGRGVLLLSFYSLGLGLPFILAGLAINRFLTASRHIKQHMRFVEYAAGALLIGVGLLLLTDRLTLLAQYFSKLFPFLTRIG